MHLQDLLGLYEQCSGRMINKLKSAVLFSSNTRANHRTDVMEVLEIERETMNEN